MNRIRTLGTALALALGLAASAHAAPVAGTLGGYYGSAWYDSNQGQVVGPYPTWSQCNAALQDAIDNAVNNFGWTITQLNYCAYRPPFGVLVDHHYELEVAGSTPRESLAVAHSLLQDIADVRLRYGADKYEAELRAVEKSSAAK